MVEAADLVDHSARGMSSMSSRDEENVATVRQVYEALNRKDLVAWAALCAPGYVIHFPGAPPLSAEAIQPLFASFFAAFSDLRHEVAEVWGAGDRVAARLSLRGTHDGPFQGMPATGRSIDVVLLNLFRMADGRMAEQWIQFDGVGMLQQLGALPAPAPVAG